MAGETRLETHPDSYRHWKLRVDGAVAHLTMDVLPDGGLRPDYELKLNSYDLGVDVELADAIQRLRFEHPEVRALVIQSALDRVFCAGANIPMLSSSSHAFKVNFCKYTNETRLYLEDSNVLSLAALNGTCAGGGYELALACDKILLIDDGSSAVSLPEVPLLAVLPGTGGLTRVVDKRGVRRDLADIFCTTSEGVRGKRAVDWDLVDAIAPRSKFEGEVESWAKRLVDESPRDGRGPGVALPPVGVEPNEDGRYAYEHVTLAIDADARVATLTMRAPKEDAPASAEALLDQGANMWNLRAFRELDHALLRLRFDFPEVGLVILRTEGDGARVLAHDTMLLQGANGGERAWFARETVSLQRRVLRRLDVTSRSFFALIEEGSCFSGSLFELALAADRAYMLEDDDEKVVIQLGTMNGDQSGGPLAMWNGLTRLQTRFFERESELSNALDRHDPIAAVDAAELGLITIAADDIDWEDDVRIGIEERASLSPDALTGMEASLRFPGEENLATKIFARLSAWQNWIFQRPNAVGPDGALTKYGQPDRPVFDWRRC
ncbi:MAG: 2,3-epoxybenzoyl-CoA dihydrolase [Myxococcota bacterium]